MTRTEELHAALRLADWEGAYTVRTLIADTLQARLAEAERLLTELTADGLNFNPGFWQAVKDARAFLKEAK